MGFSKFVKGRQVWGKVWGRCASNLILDGYTRPLQENDNIVLTAPLLPACRTENTRKNEEKQLWWLDWRENERWNSAWKHW